MKAKLVLMACLLGAMVSCKKECVQPVIVTPPVIIITPPIVVTKADTIPDSGLLKLQVQSTTNAAFSDQDIIRFFHNSDTKYHPNEDAIQPASNGDLKMAVQSSDGYNLLIDRTPYKTGMQIAINVKAKADNDCVFSLPLQTKIPQSIHIWLKDKLKADSVDLKSATYSFSIKVADTTTYGANRFKLVFR